MQARSAMPPQSASGLPGVRRKSIGPSSRPISAHESAEAIAQLQAAMSNNAPLSPNGRAQLGIGQRRAPSRSATPASPTRSRPKTPVSFAQSMHRGTIADTDSSFQLGDEVKAAGLEGILRFLGSIDGKHGIFAGVELTGASRGQGKNDGSVNGKAYFTCEPMNGLFLPSAKVELLFRRPATPPLSTSTALPKAPAVTPSRVGGVAKSSAEAARAMEAKISQGSRASKYLGMTAAQLASRQKTLGASSPAKRSASPEKKPGTPLSASVTTPRPKPRVSGPLPTPRSVSYSGRRSIGGPATPGSKSPHKRPSSALDRGTPEVPPIPASYAAERPPSSRRTSDIHGSANPFGSPSSRPETPGRPLSRASQMGRSARPGSVMSRSSSAVDEERDWEALQADRLAAVKRAEEAKTAQAEAEKSLRLGNARFEEMRVRLEDSDDRIKELEDLAATAQAAKEQTTRLHDAAESRLKELEAKLAEAVGAQRTLEEAQSAAKRQSADEDVETQRRLTETEQAFAVERANLNAELDQLREAGNALCGVYEERLDAAAAARREVEDALRAAEAELETARSAAPSTNEVALAPPSPSALSIDNETLRAEVEHLNGRLATLEDSLEEARHNLDVEAQANKQRRHESGDAATAMKNEVKLLKERLEHAARREAGSAARVGELDLALKESHKTLERERAELELLRSEATTSAPAELHQKQLDALQRERDAARAEAKTLQSRLSDAEEELRLTDELRQGENSPLSGRKGLNGDQATPTRAKNLTSPDGHDTVSLRAQHERELQARDAEIRNLRVQLDKGRRASDTSVLSTGHGSATSPAPSLGGKDEAAVVRDQLAGLKVIVSQLTTENADLGSSNKQLKRDLETLRLSNKPSAAQPTASSSTEEAVELRRRLGEAEKKHQRELEALQQEVADLESLVESKIFREDELNDELDKYRQLVKQGTIDRSTASKRSNGSDQTVAEVCAMCEGDHSLDDCPIFGGTTPSATSHSHDFCEECHEFGHLSENCSNALETF